MPSNDQPVAYPVEPTDATRALVEQKVAHAVEPFIVPDVTPDGVMFTTTFHVLRDMVDEGTLVHGGDGYRRPA